jgi:small-conductance mechanosensitive channel
MNRWVDQVGTWIGLDPFTVTKLFLSLFLLLAVFVAKTSVLRLIRRRIQDADRLYRIRRTVNYTAGVIALLALGRIWFHGLHDIGVLLGLAAAGLAIALKEPLLNLVGWVYILTRRPFVVGDRIESNGVMGDVIDIRLFQVYLLECGRWVEADQFTGRIALLPNGSVFQHTLINYTHGFEPIWDELAVVLSFESDWRRAKRLLEGINTELTSSYGQEAEQQLRDTAGEHFIQYGALNPAVYTSVKENGVCLTLRYLVPPRERRGMNEKLWEAILDAFEKEPNIQFAYPTTRFMEHPLEAKAALRRGGRLDALTEP